MEYAGFVRDKIYVAMIYSDLCRKVQGTVNDLGKSSFVRDTGCFNV